MGCTPNSVPMVFIVFSRDTCHQSLVKLPAGCFIFENLKIRIHSTLRSVAETEVVRRPGKFDADRCRPSSFWTETK